MAVMERPYGVESQEAVAQRGATASPTRSPGMAVDVRGICKSFPVSGKDLPVLDGVSLCVARGEWVTLVGPSGCGKTTLLRILAGLISADAGRMTVCRAESGEVGPAYLPQSDTLLPWRNALDNATLAAELARRPRAVARQEARALLAQFGLAGFERLYPSQLSGGMRQRLAIIRTFLAHRELLLLDEPLGALDPLTRAQLQDWLVDVWNVLRKTVVLVTHDVEEAILLSDRVLVLTPRPARVCHAERIALTRPRVRTAMALVEARATLLNALLPKDV